MLLQLARDTNRIKGNKAEIEKLLTHDELARLIGSSRQTFITTLNVFEKKELIFITKKEIIINNITDLKKFGKEDIISYYCLPISFNSSKCFFIIS